MRTGSLPSPLIHFVGQLNELCAADVLDMGAVGRLLVDLAADGRAELSLAGERVMHHGDVATLVPPRDVHNHGHVVGSGPAPYSLILLGDDMFVFERQEYDPGEGTWQALRPGDPGRSNR